MDAWKEIIDARCRAFLLFFSLGFQSQAADFQVDQWTTEHGLPQNTILAITQTPDGYIWLATWHGLVRFDGVRFTVFNPVNTPALPSARITWIQTDRHGWLWIISEQGHLTRMAGGQFEPVNGRFGLPIGVVVPKPIDPDGNLWVGIDGIISNYRLGGDRFVVGNTINSLSEDFPSEAQLQGLVAANGCLWLSRESQWERLYSDAVPRVTGRRGIENISQVCPDRAGGTWLLGERSLRHHPEGSTRVFSNGAPVHGTTALAEDLERNLWVTTWREGLFVIPPGGLVERVPLGAASAPEPLRNLFIDIEGNIWVGSDLGGLYRVKPRHLRTFTQSSGLTGLVVKSVTGDRDGGIWVAHENGIDSIRFPGALTNGTSEPVIDRVFGRSAIWTISPDQESGFCFGFWPGGVGHWEAGSVRGYQQDDPPVHSGNVRVLAPRKEGGTWLGTSEGLWVLSDGRMTPSMLPSDLASRDVRAIINEAPGRLYVGIYGDGLLERKNGHWSRFGKTQGLADEAVLCLYQDSDGAIWIGTAFGGLSRFQDGHIVNFSLLSPDLPKLVSCIIEDDLGYLWFGSVDGIHRVARKELNDLARGQRRDAFVYHYGKGDGLATTECAYGMQPTVCKGQDGRLWFATIHGLSMVDPKDMRFNSRRPPVRIEDVLVDGHSVGDRSTDQSPLALSPRNHQLEIRYTALSFTAPEKMRFKYRLEDLATDWTDARGRRSAFFEGLRPGDYRFRVTGSNNDGVWNESGASLAFRVLPFYWQTVWFRALVGMTLGGLVLFSYRQRIGRLEQERVVQRNFSRRLIESQENERKRIASELHDSLGQNLLIIKNRATMGLNERISSPRVNEQLREISEVSLSAIEEVRTIAQALRPQHLDRFGLTKSIGAMARQLSEAGPVRIEAEVAPLDDLFSPTDEMNLYRIIQESLNNVLKHSGAALARIIIKREADLIKITIHDNGQGFDPKALSPMAGSGFGLTSIRERVKMLGGIWQLESVPGKGTRLEIEIAVPSIRDE